ncbi:hypothetical protein [Streptomyces decoyicus]
MPTRRLKVTVGAVLPAHGFDGLLGRTSEAPINWRHSGFGLGFEKLPRGVRTAGDGQPKNPVDRRARGAL